MKISYSWLNEYLTYDDTIDIEEIASILTSIGLEVEAIEKYESIKGGLEKFYIGEIISCEKHPNADKLSLTQVNLGEKLGIKKIVCGAPNVAKGQKVVVASEGAMIYLPSGESFTIKNTKIRGEESCGMICAEDELGIGDSHAGILVLDNSAIVGIPAADYFNLSVDYIIEIGLTPNRTDAMSHRGVARDLSVAMNARGLKCEFHENGKTLFQVENKKSNQAVQIHIRTEKAPKFGGIIIEGLQNQLSPDWMINRLKAIGESPKNLLIDTTNYILHDLGQPLHAYDWTKIDPTQIEVSELETSTDFIALNGDQLKLLKGDVVIQDASNVIGIAGIMGSKDSAIDNQTSAIFLEGAYFSAKSIRQTSQRLNLRSESAIKFEKGIDPNGTEYALTKARNILMSLCPESKSSDLMMSSQSNFEYWETKLTRKKLDIYANTSIPKDKIDFILQSLGIEILEYKDETWFLSVPRFKEDVRREEDVIEEILRIYGYNQLPYPKFLKSNLSFTQGLSMTQFESKVNHLLVGSGYREIITNSISQSKYYPEENPIKLLNSMTSELDCMRSSMLPSVLEVMEYNINRDQKDLALFEIGNEYSLNKKGNYSQRKKLMVVQTGMFEIQNWANSRGKTNDFFQIKSILEKLMQSLNLSVSYAESTSAPLNYGLEILLNQFSVGYVGEAKINSKHFDIRQKVFVLELDLDYLYLQVQKQKTKYTEVSKFPSVRRDLAIVLNQNATFSQVETVCKKSLGQHLMEIDLFDIFKHPSIGEDKKSYAVRFALQNKEKTMSDKEIDSMMQKLISNLNKELQAEIRS